MTAIILNEAEAELDAAFEYHNEQRAGLGHELIDEFRRGVEKVLQHPAAWHPLGATYRRYRLHRFPYGIVYRIDSAADRVVVVAVMHLSQEPGKWHGRERR